MKIQTAAMLGDMLHQTVELQGCIHKVRQMSGFAFVLLKMRRDVLQCVWTESSGFPLEQIPEGSWVTLTGIVVPEPRAREGYEVQLCGAVTHSQPTIQMPIVINGKKLDAGIERLLDYRPLTLRHPNQRAIFRIQEALARAFRNYLTSLDFCEIHTPKLVFAGAEGGANVFSLPYFDKTAYLAQSPQFYKQMMVGVYERVFEIGPVFRAEKHDTARHLNEYTSLDLEMGFIESFHDIMDCEKAVLGAMMNELRESCAAELELLKVELPQTETIPQIRFHDAKAMVEKQRPVTDWLDFEPEEERLICEIMREESGSEFVFVTHYPSAKRPFYAMDDSENAQVTLSFDLLFRGVEITTGGQRIHEYETQIAKMQTRNMDVAAFESYLMMHKYGMPPHGGLGLGLERLTAQLLGLSNLRYATLFPRDTVRLTP